MKNFQRFVQFNLVYNLAVILWGAFVRASGSGAGCGAHWPLCNGEVIPQPQRIQTWIEFFHRGSSGLSLVFVVIAFLWARSLAAKNSLLRKATTISLLAILLEAALGAGLVLLRLVEFDQSALRAISIGLHSVNTLFLLATLTTTAWISQFPRFYTSEKVSVLPRHPLFWTTLGIFLVLATAGAITALGDTLFPTSSLTAGFQQDLTAGAHFLIKLRVIHPLLAVLWIMIAFAWSKHLETSALMNARNLFLLAVITQFLLGFLNWMLLAPTGMQLVHLLVADLVFISFWISGMKYETRESGLTT